MLDRSAVFYCSTLPAGGLGEMETIAPILLLNPFRVIYFFINHRAGAGLAGLPNDREKMEKRRKT